MSRSLGMLLLAVVLIGGCEQPGGHSPVAIVDLDAVARALGRDDAIAQQINAANEQLSSQVLQIAQTLQEQLREQQELLGDDGEQTQLDARTAEANRQLQATQQEARQRAALFRTAVVNEFRNEVAPVAEDIARKRGARVVLTAAVPTVWFDAEVDITGEVITALRAGGSRPRPAAQPAPAPAPAPAEEAETDAG